jgi:phosphate starvation-inducible PhoH-like protein
MVVTGDPGQSDLLTGMSGLSDISQKLKASPNIAVVELESKDIVRHPLVGELLEILD